MISIRSGVLVAVNLPPGSTSGSATPPTGLLGSGLLGLTEATSNVASGDTAAEGAAGGETASCADAAAAASRMARATTQVERIIVISTFQLLPGTLLHVWRMRLSDQGASTLMVSGNNAGVSIHTASVAGSPASGTPAARSTVTHAAANAAETRTAPHAEGSVRSRSASDLQKR